MRNIELEIECQSQEEAENLTNRLMNGTHWVGRKHNKWVLFITCPVDEILHLGQELHHELHQHT